MNSVRKKITLLGSGNVGFHLAHAFYNIGDIIDCIYSRNKLSAAKLAIDVQSFATDEINNVPQDSDFYIIAVKDDSILEVAEKLAKINPNGIVCHTSGVFNTELLAQYFNEYGCFYPLQTLSKHRDVDYTELPLCILGSSKFVEKELLNLSSSISQHTSVVTDEEREKLHLAAVFVNNFTNFMYVIAKEYCDENDIDFNLLLPLIRETADKVYSVTPKDAQTGPAIRQDEETIQAHMKLMKGKDNMLDIYRFITRQIQNNIE